MIAGRSEQRPGAPQPASSRRVLVLAGIGVLLLSLSLVARQRVSDNYRTSQKKLKEYNERQAVIRQFETEASQEELEIARLRAAIDADPKNETTRWKLADKLQKLRQFEPAREQIEAIAKLAPKNEAAALALGNVRLACGDTAAAEQAYRITSLHWPKNAEAWQGLAATRYHLKRYHEAAMAAEQALALDPKDDGNRYIYASAALEYASQFPATPAEAQQEARPLAVARVQFERLAKDNPNRGEIYYKLGLTCSRQRDKQFASQYLMRAHELLPERGDIAFDLVQALKTSADTKTAGVIIEDSIKRHPKMAGFYFLQSDMLQAGGDAARLPQAIEAARKATVLAPSVPQFFDNLGNACLRANKLAEARDAFEGSLKADENRALPYQQLAAIYSRMGDIKRSTTAARFATRMVHNDQTLRQVEELSKQYPEDIRLLTIRADRYRDLKMYPAAFAVYEQIVKMKPDDTYATQQVAQIKQKFATQGPKR